MFIHMEILVRSFITDKIELMVSTPNEAMTMFTLFEKSDGVIAWRCLTHEPEDFGCASPSRGAWLKYRDNATGFTTRDYGVTG